MQNQFDMGRSLIKYTANTVYISFNAAAQYSGHTDAVYVSLDGQDSEGCGSLDYPCKSIAKAVHQMNWGGHIYLNGIGTERKPYDCHLSTAHVQQPGIVQSRPQSPRPLDQRHGLWSNPKPEPGNPGSGLILRVRRRLWLK